MVENTTPVPTAASQWKNKVAVDGKDLLLPSGNTARIKQISPQAFLTSGMIPDPLSAIVRLAINSKQGMKPSDVKKIAEDPEKLNAAMELFDRVLAYVVVMPPVEMPPTCAECHEYFNVDDRHRRPDVEGYHRYQESPRDPEVLYADQVDMDDKMFVFNFCLGGTQDLTQFREEQRANMESVSNGKDVRSAAKRTAGRS